LSQFWPMDPGLAAMVPPGMHHELARFQMGSKVTVDFPDAWRANIVDVQMERPSWMPDQEWALARSESELPLVARMDEALEEIHHRCAAESVDEEQWMAELGALSANDVTQIIIEACLKHNVTPDELLVEVSQGQFEY